MENSDEIGKTSKNEVQGFLGKKFYEIISLRLNYIMYLLMNFNIHSFIQTLEKTRVAETFSQV